MKILLFADAPKTNPNKPNFTRESPFVKPFGEKRLKLLQSAPFAGKMFDGDSLDRFFMKGPYYGNAGITTQSR